VPLRAWVGCRRCNEPQTLFTPVCVSWLSAAAQRQTHSIVDDVSALRRRRPTSRFVLFPPNNPGGGGGGGLKFQSACRYRRVKMSYKERDKKFAPALLLLVISRRATGSNLYARCPKCKFLRPKGPWAPRRRPYAEQSRS
jgi:hypothetical protein